MCCPLPPTKSHTLEENIFEMYLLTKSWVMAWCLRVLSITGTNVDYSSVRSSNTHFRTILQEICQPSINKISLNITYLIFHSNALEGNELIGRKMVRKRVKVSRKWVGMYFFSVEHAAFCETHANASLGSFITRVAPPLCLLPGSEVRGQRST